MSKRIEMNYKMEDNTYEVLYPQTQVENITDFLSYMKENYYSKSECDGLFATQNQLYNSIIVETTAVELNFDTINIRGLNGKEKIVLVVGQNTDDTFGFAWAVRPLLRGITIDIIGSYNCVVTWFSDAVQLKSNFNSLYSNKKAILFY